MNQKKHIALFTYDLDYGGTERVVSRLANELSQYYKVTIVLLFNQVSYQVNNEIKIIALANTKTSYNSKNPKKWIQYFSFFSKYRKVLAEENIDVSLSFLAIPNIINGYAKSKNPYTVKIPTANKGSIKNPSVNMPMDISSNPIKNPFILD